MINFISWIKLFLLRVAMLCGATTPTVQKITDADFLEIVLLKQRIKITNKVTACNHFLKFLDVIKFIRNSAQGTQMASAFCSITTENLAQAELQCKVTRMLYQSNSTVEKVHSKTALFEALPTEQEIQTMTTKFMQLEINEAHGDSGADFIRLRNFVLLALACHVPIRLEPWRYLTCRMVLEGDRDEDVCKILIKGSHKILVSYGYPNPGIPLLIYERLAKFVEKVHRGCFMEKEFNFWQEMPVFCTLNGQALSTSSVSHHVIAASKQYIGREIPSNGFRKFMSTTAQLRHETDLALSHSFLHSANTARKHYYAGTAGQHVFANNYQHIMNGVTTVADTSKKHDASVEPKKRVKKQFWHYEVVPALENSKAVDDQQEAKRKRKAVVQYI